MRILIKLNALEYSEASTSAFDRKYHHKLQGFIYSLLKDTRYSELHNKKGYKFFCFSNLFPIGSTKKGDIKQFLISSPNKDLIKVLKEKLTSLTQVRIGSINFKINSITKIEPKIPSRVKLITGTPIVIRIPKQNYSKYNIKPNNYEYIYWKPKYLFNAFIKQLEDNLFKKYNDFYNTTIKDFPIFEHFIFKKDVCNHIILHKKEVKVFGSNWEFIFDYLDKESRKLLQFGLETGFGEFNSLGFGFINKV